jgi:hypothetical protein
MARSYAPLACAALLAMLALAAAAPAVVVASPAAAARGRALLGKKNKASDANATAAAASNATANGTVAAASTTKKAGTPLMRFSRGSLLTSDSSALAYSSLGLAKALIQLLQPFAAAGGSGSFTISPSTALSMSGLLAQAAAASNDVASKVMLVLADGLAPLG